VYPVAPLYAPAPAAALPDTAGLVIGYASLDERAIERGVRILGEVLETFTAEENAGRASNWRFLREASYVGSGPGAAGPRPERPP
jgi:GntR family transcriptional regulator / MocR family aminotransferase